MTIRTSLMTVKIASVVFGSAAIVFAVKYFDGVTQNHKLKETIQLDKKNHSNELSEIFSRYDTELLRNKKLLELTTQKLNTTSESKEVVYKKTNNNTSLNNVSNDVALLKTIDSLKYLINIEKQEKLGLKNQMDFLNAKNKDLLKQNSNNEALVAITRNLTATNVFANGIKIVSNNIIETKKFSKTEQIKVCFTLLENKATVKGNKDIFIQIINPKKVVMNKDDEFVQIGEQFLHYSAKTNVFYDNEELDVCAFVGSDKKDILKGDYEINIFSGAQLIGNNVFSLK